eukprot:PhF_6_TR21148/c0_g1_i1/m.30429
MTYCTKNLTFHVVTKANDFNRNMVRVSVRGKLPMRIQTLMEKIGRKCERVTRISVGPYSIRGTNAGTFKAVHVPSAYLKYVNPTWQPFIERDWPYFRAARLRRLRALSRVKILSPKEMVELDEYSMEELQNIISTYGSGSDEMKNGDVLEMTDAVRENEDNDVDSDHDDGKQPFQHFEDFENSLLQDPQKMSQYAMQRPITKVPFQSYADKVLSF